MKTEFYEMLKNYVDSKYGITVNKVPGGIVLTDMAGYYFYEDSEFSKWENSTEEEWKEAIDKLVYNQLLELFINVFDEEYIPQ